METKKIMAVIGLILCVGVLSVMSVNYVAEIKVDKMSKDLFEQFTSMGEKFEQEIITKDKLIEDLIETNIQSIRDLKNEHLKTLLKLDIELAEKYAEKLEQWEIENECEGCSGGSSGGSSSSNTPSTSEVTWEEVYSYSDDYSDGGFFIDDSTGEIEVSRAYVWKSEFGNIFLGKIKIVASSDDYDWYGSRLALINPENSLERYELRLLPNEQKVEVRYVDRTNRSGTFSGYDSDTISETLSFAFCEIKLDEWYYINILRIGDTYKAQIVSMGGISSFVKWEDNRITGDKLAIGMQSAGKYVTSRFEEILAI